MADRLVRDEIWESERFLGLQTDTQRLAFFRLLHEVDDYGNMEGGLRRVYRMLTTVMHVKSPEETAAILGALNDADLIRFYVVNDPSTPGGGREFIHLPRLRTHRNYRVRKCPPYAGELDGDRPLGKKVRELKQGLALDLAATSQQRAEHVPAPVDNSKTPNDLSTDPPVSPGDETKAKLETQALMEKVTATSLACATDISAGVGVGEGEGEKNRTTLSLFDEGVQNPKRARTRADAVEVLLYLNELTGRRFRARDETLKPIEARLRQGYSVARLKEIALLMNAKWGKDERMADYLRPKTLYAATNCANYDGVLPNGVDE